VNWQGIKKLTHVQIGAVLALLIVVFLPNYGIEKFGPSPVVPAFLLFLLGGWLVWRERLRIYATRAQRRWVILFLLLFVPVLASIPGSFKVLGSFSIAVVTALYYLVGVALVDSLKNAKERSMLVKWATLILLFWVADAVLQYFLRVDLFGIRIDDTEGRLLGPFDGNLRLSLFAVLLMPMVLDRLFSVGLWAVLGAFGVTGAVAMMGGSRSVLFFLSIIVVALLFRLPGRGRKWAAIGILAMVGGITLALSPVLQQRFSLFSELRTPSFATLNHLLSYRMNIWDTAYHMFQDRPFTGVGAGAFQAAYNHYSQRPDDVFVGGEVRAFHAHQLYIGLAAETGLIGLLSFCAIVALGGIWYRRATVVQRARAWPFALGLLVYVFPLNSQPVLYLQWLFPVLLLLLAGMLAALDDPSTTRNEKV
jgi:O-antigen ligase